MDILKGIDVSTYQGKIDWEAAKDSGVNFAILRAGYGMYDYQIDNTFEYNYSECKRLGIPIGTYWYTYARNLQEAQKEVDVYLKALKGKKTELPNFLDMEYEPDIKALSKQMRTDICKFFMESIKKAGYLTGLYCSYDWIKNWLYEKQLSNFDKWIAQYSNQCSYKNKDLAFWQYTSSGKIPGIKGNVDLDYCYKDYIAKKQGEWKKNSKGWWYELPNKDYAKNQWLKIDNKWYWFNSSGYAVKGYQTIGGKNYYFAEKAALGKVKECQLIVTNESGEIL